MATSNYTDPLPTFKLVHTTPDGREFSFTVIRLTLQCYIMESDHTGATRQFPTAAALHNFWRSLKTHLNTVYAVKLLPAVAASLQTAPAEHVIRIDEMNVSQKFSEIDTTSEHKSANIADLTPVDPSERIRALKLAKSSAAIRTVGGAAGRAKFQKRVKWLNREIARYEAQIKSVRVAFGQACEYCHKTDLKLAMAQFERKYGRKVTHIKISKYDHIPADVDVTGIDVARSAAVLPSDCWLGGAR